MKSILITLLITCSIFCQKGSGTVVKQQFKEIEWLIGKWQRQNVRPGKTAFEEWQKTETNLLSGIGISMQGNDTTFIEKLRIEILDNQLVYVADVRENKEPTYFKIIEIKKNSFISENPNHDFPKRISYKLEKDHMIAQISGNGKSIDFIFKKME